jgi:TatD DNase family protein
MIDSHCHLADEAFGSDLEAVVGRASEAGIERALCILSAGDEKESAAAARVRALWPTASFSVGVHPHNAATFAGRADDLRSTLRAAVTAEGARAIGEIGLDYHYDFAPRDVQHAVFAAQVDEAVALGLPVIIHTREATDDTFRILRDAGDDVRGVFHCFTGDVAMARAALEIGFFVSLAGIVTFPKAEMLRDVARFVPEEKLLIETDAPYLAPVPHRGKRNEPSFVARVAETVADLRKIALHDLEARLTHNFDTFLGPTVSHQTA